MICHFCCRTCDISEGRLGACGVRTVKEGILQDTAYGRLVSFAVDPVEKKPLYHFLPGSRTVSIAMSGCNFSCDFCQNWEISQQPSVEGQFVDPEQVVMYALEHGHPSISYTYSEPLVWQDYMLDVARIAKSHGILNVMVSNGSFSMEALARILPLIDAYNIDLKGDAAFYAEICGGELSPVMEGIRAIAVHGSHLEVTTMLIEGLHTAAMVSELGGLLMSVGVNVWHLSRFFPRYHMEGRQATSERFLEEMLAVAVSSGVPFVYPGNSGLSAETYCPGCGALVRAYPGLPVVKGVCSDCGKLIYGRWG